MTLNELLKTLPSVERAKLDFAFEHSLSKYYEYAPGKYIGVNVGHIKKLIPNQIVGVWSCGNVRVD